MMLWIPTVLEWYKRRHILLVLFPILMILAAGCAVSPETESITVATPTVESVSSDQVTAETGGLDHVTLEPAELTLEVRKDHRFTATAYDRSGNPIPGLTYTFSSDERAGRVDSRGWFVAGTVAGEYETGVTVEVAQGSISVSATAKVTLEPGPLSRVALEPKAAALHVGQMQQFRAAAYDRFNNSIPDQTSTFGASPRAGYVDGEGLFVAGTRAGVYAAGVSARTAQGSVTRSVWASVTVEPGPLDHVTLEPVVLTLPVTEDHQLIRSARDRFDNAIFGLTYTLSSHQRAGKVDSRGRFVAGTRTGIYENGVTVEATQGSVTRSATTAVTVTHGKLARLEMTGSSRPLKIGEKASLEFGAFDAYDNSVADPEVQWSVSGPANDIGPDGALTAGTAAGSFVASATLTIDGETFSAESPFTILPNPLDQVSLLPTRRQPMPTVG